MCVWKTGNTHDKRGVFGETIRFIHIGDVGKCRLGTSTMKVLLKFLVVLWSTAYAFEPITRKLTQEEIAEFVSFVCFVIVSQPGVG